MLSGSMEILPMPSFSRVLTRTFAFLLCFAVAGLAAQAEQLTVTGVGFIEFYDEETGDPTADAVLSIEVIFDVDPATPAEPSNSFLYIGAGTNPEVFVDILELNVFGPEPPDLSGLPYFTILSGMGIDGTPNDVADAFVSPSEFSFSFPTNPNGGAPTAVPEPLYVSLDFLSPVPTDLATGVANLLAAPDPLALIDDGSIDFSLGAIGNPNLEDVFFQLDGISVPEPSGALPASLLLLAGFGRIRRRG